MAIAMEEGLGPGHIVLDGDPAPLKRGVQPPIFGPCLLWPNGWMDQDATWHGASPKKGRSPLPRFSAHVYCGQTAGWIKMPLRAEVNLGSGDTVLDRVAAPP